MVIAGIVAGGSGSRMGNADRPKQFLNLCGKPIIAHTVEKFLSSKMVDHVIVGVHPEWKEYMEELAGSFCRPIVVTEGGEDRNSTLCNIIEAAKTVYGAADDTVFLTHDAVRPFVTERIIEDNVSAVREFGACGTVYPATDTIFNSADRQFISDIPLRDQMFQAQTPQSFTLKTWNEVFSSLTEDELAEATDACRLFWMKGIKVRLVTGEVTNIKITYPQDLALANAIAGHGQTIN